MKNIRRTVSLLFTLLPNWFAQGAELNVDPTGGSSSLSAEWVNPVTGEDRQAGKLASEQAKVIAPSGWKDALLYLKK